MEMTQKQALEWVLLSLEKGKINNGIEMLKDILEQMVDPTTPDNTTDIYKE
jgi:hypothetical protein